MGNKHSRKLSPAASYSRETAYLTAVPTARHDRSTLSPELEELLQRENLMGVTGKLKAFADTLDGGLDIPDFVGLSVEDLRGSGLTPLQRRRLIRAATKAATRSTGKAREKKNALQGFDSLGGGDESPHILRKEGEGRHNRSPRQARGSKVANHHSSSSDFYAVPLRKRDSTSPGTSRNKLSKKGRQLSAQGDLYRVSSSGADVVRENGVTLSVIESVVDQDRDNSDETHSCKASPPPLPEKQLKRAASESTLLDKLEVETSTEDASDVLYQCPLTIGIEIKPQATPPPGSPTSSTAEHWSKYSPVHFILETMRHDIGDSDTLFSACQTLTRLVKQKLENRKAAYDDGAVTVISQALQQHCDVDAVVEQGLLALARLCPGVPLAVAEIVSSGGITGIVDLVSRHAVHGGVCRAACLLLYNISYEDFDSRGMMIDAGVVQAALGMLENFSADPSLLMMVSAVVACVSAQTPRAKVAVSGEEGLLSIAIAMQLHVTHSKLQMYGCAAIANVMFGEVDITEKAYADGITQFVITAVRNHVTHPGVLLYGVKALANFMQAGDAWRLVLDSDVVDIVLDACRAYQGNATLHLWTCYLLHHATDEGQGEAKRKLMEHYIVNWCIFVMSVHCESSEVYWAAKCLLHWFPPYNQFSLKPPISPV